MSTLVFDQEEKVSPRPFQGNSKSAPPRLSQRSYTIKPPFVAQLSDAWLVGTHATPFTCQGKMLLSSFRNQLTIMGAVTLPLEVISVEGRVLR